MSDFAATPFLLGMAATAGVVLAVFLATFAVGLAAGRVNVVDTTWGLGFVAVAVTDLVLAGGVGDPVRAGLVVGLTCVWGLRLAAYIGWRSRGAGEDPRYAELLDRGGGSRAGRALRLVFLPQAAVCWFVSLPVQAALYERSPAGALAGLGAAVWLAGFGFEVGGDWQLARFRADPANRGRVLDHGLWRYTRHPNYFGDSCQWWGLYLVAAGQWQGAATVLSPMLMTYLLARKTGKPLLERRMSSTRPGYAAYVGRTSGFLPRPPRPG